MYGTTPKSDNRWDFSCQSKLSSYTSQDGLGTRDVTVLKTYLLNVPTVLWREKKGLLFHFNPQPGDPQSI